MKIMDRIIGVLMVCNGIGLFIFALMLTPYMNSLSVIMFCIIGIPSAAVLASGITVLIMCGWAVATGKITIRMEGGN